MSFQCRDGIIRQLLLDTGGECSLDKGLILVFTGEGNGKTTAALGIALRAAGHRMYVSFIQFLKNRPEAGEARAAERLNPEIEFISPGKGFVNCCGDDEAADIHRKAAREALAVSRRRILSGSWDVVVLDEVNAAVALGLLDVAEVLDVISRKPRKLHVVLTGRNAHPSIIEAADLATDMRSLKHPCESGIPARKGIDF